MSDLPTGKRSLYTAILEAQRRLSALAKDGENKFHGFKYATTDGIVEQCRVALHECGLVVTRWGSSAKPGESIQKTSKDGPSTAPSAWVEVQFLIAHAETGESEVRTVAMYAEAEKGQPLDKKILGAHTGALGYFLIGLLLVPRLDENEINLRDDTKYDPNALGTDGEKWVKRELAHLQADLGWLKARLLKRMPDLGKSLEEPIRQWNRRTVVHIKDELASLAASIAPVQDDAAAAGFPQDTRHTRSNGNGRSNPQQTGVDTTTAP